jgi:hypothetical protein
LTPASACGRRGDGGAGASRPLQLRSARRLPGAVPRRRSGPDEGARHRAHGDGGKPDVVDPHLNWGEQVKSIRLEVDQDRARALGLTPQDIAQMLQTLLSGYVVSQYREGIEHIDVVARAVPSERLELDRLPSLTITTRDGVAVPLSQIARLHYEFEEPILWRRNRDTVLTVRGAMYDGNTQLLIENPINRYLINSPMLPDLKKNPDGSLTLYIQKDSPGADKESNWLPAPDGPIYMVMRLYWPKPEALDGTWKPSAVVAHRR